MLASGLQKLRWGLPGAPGDASVLQPQNANVPSFQELKEGIRVRQGNCVR